MKDWIEQNQITEVECIVPDLAGAARGKIMPASKFTDTTTLRMPQSVFMQSVTGDYPDLTDEMNPLDVDMLLKPDPYTIRQLPWAREPSAQVIHDCFDMEGAPISFSPRQVPVTTKPRSQESAATPHRSHRPGRTQWTIFQYRRGQ
jgi:glutamine synthetase